MGAKKFEIMNFDPSSSKYQAWKFQTECFSSKMKNKLHQNDDDDDEVLRGTKVV